MRGVEIPFGFFLACVCVHTHFLLKQLDVSISLEKRVSSKIAAIESSWCNARWHMFGSEWRQDILIQNFFFFLFPPHQPTD